MVLIAIGLLLGFAAMEITLRAFPSEISMRVLSRFESGLRARIAEDLGLRTRKNLREFKSSDRTDGGPAFYMPKPSSVIRNKNEPADLDAGGTKVSEVDGLGFCNAPDLIASAPFDVVVVGDSFTFCTSVATKDTVAPMLANASGLSVYNLGVQGIGPDAYLELLKAHVDDLQPRIVIMNIYEGNDLRDVARFDAQLTIGSAGAEKGGSHRVARSYALQFLRANYLLVKERVQRNLNPEVEINFRYSAPVNGQNMPMNLRNRDTDEVEYAIALRDGDLSFEAFRGPLENFVDWSLASDIVSILTYIPSMYSVYDGSVVFEDPEIGQIVQKFSADQREWFRAFAKSSGINFFDLTPFYQNAAANGVLTHFPGNVHLTPAGHKVVADNVLSVVMQASRAPLFQIRHHGRDEHQ